MESPQKDTVVRKPCVCVSVFVCGRHTQRKAEVDFFVLFGISVVWVLINNLLSLGGCVHSHEGRMVLFCLLPPTPIY